MPKAIVPDAWDDDWESLADKEVAAAPASPPPRPAPPTDPVKITKAQRLAKHAEENKKIWESADSPAPDAQSYHFLTAQSDVPLKSDFKAPLRLLSRKPARTGAGNDHDEADDDDESRAAAQLTAEERQLKAQRDRDEKLRRYEEARRRILGDDTPPLVEHSGGRGSNQQQQQQQQQASSSNRTRGGRARGSTSRGGGDQSRLDTTMASKELFDPNYTAKPGSRGQQRNEQTSRPNSGTSTPRVEESLVRAPKGPDPSGRGGFAQRGLPRE